MRALLPVLLLAACTPPERNLDPVAPYDPVPLVDPLIGTGGLGAEVVGLNPGAAVPFGFVQVGPDTRDSATGQPAFYHYGGYHYDDDRIDGFGHTHANGMGVNDFGGVVITPRAAWDDAFVDPWGRAAPFTHDAEEASPGFYGVTLQDDGTEVAIAATSHGAVHRYTFTDGASPVVMWDLGYTLGTVEIGEAWARVEDGRLIGEQVIRGGYSARIGGIRHHVVATFDPAPVGSGVWDGESPREGAAIEGSDAGIWLSFPEGTTTVTMRIALSATDLAGAEANHAAEVAGRSLDEVRAAAEEAWREALGTVRVRGGTEEQRIIQHTALYHAMLWPNVYSDVDGRYRGFDGEVHTSDTPHHTNFSLWDTFRTTHPLFTLAMPERHEVILASLVRMAEQGGDLPRWPIGHGYTGGMISSPGAIVLAEAHLKGLEVGGADAFAHAVKAAEGPRPNAGRRGIEAYLADGFVPLESGDGAASRTLEHAWADHALALWAADLGDPRAEALAAQAGHWRNTWDPAQGFFAGRFADGSFNTVSDPLVWTRDFVEGTAWHYTFGVPFDIDGLVEVHDGGDRAAFAGRLRDYWDLVYAEPDDQLYDSYYWHGNEPDLHYAFLGSLVDDRAVTAEASRWILANRYSTAPDGLDGNDDAGTLSSWWVLASAGLYPIAGTSRYAIGSPLWDRVEVGDLVVRVEDPEAGPYVAEVRVGERVVDEGFVEHANWVEAGEIVFVMSAEPVP